MRSIPALAWLALILSVCVSIAATGERIITVTQPQFTRYSTARQTDINGKLEAARFVAYSTAHQLTVGPQGPQGERGFRGYSGATGPAGTFSRPATFSNISAHAAGVPAGGTTGQKLIKNSNSSYDTRWETDTDLALSDANPVMAGTAAPGTGTTASRTDHVHPSDTSRLAASVFTSYSGTRLAKTGGTLTGNVLVKPANSTTAFQVAKSDATGVLTVDTSNGRVGIGTASPTQALDVAGALAVTNGTAAATTVNFGTANTGLYGSSSQVNIATGGTIRAAFLSLGTYIYGLLRPSSDATYDLGTSSAGWKNLYLSGDARIGGNLGLGVTSFDSSAAKSLYIANGTAPAAHSTSDSVVWSTSSGLNIIPSGSTATTTIGATTAKFPGTVVLSGTSSPAAADACTAGTITWDASYIYVCTASGAWKRSALTGGY